MKTVAYTRIALFLLFSLWPVVTQARGEIVFAAQHYRKTGKIYKDDMGSWGEMLRDAGSYHLYRITPDGSGRKQLTSGNENNVLPCFSPDGKQIAFVRRPADFGIGNNRVCLIGRTGGKVTTLLRLPNAYHVHRLKWSPDGGFIAVSSSTEAHDDSSIALIRVSDHTRRSFAGAEKCAWSPDGHWLYMCHNKKKASLLNMKTMRTQKVSIPLSNPCWLDNQTLLGETGFEKATDRWPGRFLSIVNRQGHTLHKVPFEAPINGWDLDEECLWFPLVGNRTKILLQTAEEISDGTHWYCYIVDIKTAHPLPLRDGMLIGISPQGDEIAIANHKWMGPYKRGGRRVGPLEIVSLKNGKVRKITRGILSIYGGDWYHPKRRQQQRSSTAVVRR